VSWTIVQSKSKVDTIAARTESSELVIRDAIVILTSFHHGDCIEPYDREIDHHSPRRPDGPSMDCVKECSWLAARKQTFTATYQARFDELRREVSQTTMRPSVTGTWKADNGDDAVVLAVPRSACLVCFYQQQDKEKSDFSD
jgi:hypothetical protein